MKRNMIFVAAGAVFCVLLAGCGQRSANEYVLKGVFTDMEAPATVVLTYTVDGRQVVDTASVANGRFEFRGTVEEPAAGYITASGTGEGTRVSLYVEPGTVTVTGGKDFSDAVISGSRTKGAKDEWDEINIGAWGPTEELVKWYTSLPQEEQDIQDNRDRFLQESIRLKGEYADLAASFIRSHPDSWYALAAVYVNATGLVPEYECALEIFNCFTPEVRDTPTGRKMREKIEGWKAVMLGGIAPDFTLNDQFGNQWKLSDRRGQWVFIDFWASWCGACRLESPNVLKAYDALKDDDFMVVAISIDNNDEKGVASWVKAIEEDGMPWVQLLNNKGDDNEVAVVYSVNVVPQNFLIDPQGRIVAKSIYGQTLADQIRGFMESGR